MKYKLDVVTRVQDNQDGGYTIYIYNNLDDLIKDHPNYDEDITQEEINDILNEEDAYENGYIGEDSFEVEVVDGVAKLVSNISFGVGQ